MPDDATPRPMLEPRRIPIIEPWRIVAIVLFTIGAMIFARAITSTPAQAHDTNVHDTTGTVARSR